MAQRLQELFIFFFLAIFSRATSLNKPHSRATLPLEAVAHSYCLSWRLAVEANNVGGWRTVPAQCLHHIETYMTAGQYDRDLEFIVDQILNYVRGIVLSGDGLDAWILDVDDTCISNVIYYKGKRFGCEPYDPAGFVAWASKGGCPAIPAVLRLFKELVPIGFKVFLVTGRDQENLGQVTIDNLHNQEFIGYERLILRTRAYNGQSAVTYKSNIRKQLVEEGYRIWGNVGDQWSDLHGDFVGNRTFKLPNPMYFVP
ncbi:acid phosphatase 1 isoform X2 [Jatropha curcas]|nr:acid phosphatase 1 isoform X2 [Jatropha curcas]